jgi:hypothetical protein
MPELTALAQILGLYAALTLSFLGWGRAARVALSGRDRPPESLGTDLWVGWAAALTVFEFVQICRPLAYRESIAVLGIGIALALRPSTWARLRPRGRPDRAGVACLALWAGAALWVAARSMDSPHEFDAGMYHLQTIRWLNVLPIMPGLGNLHGRLAFNSAFYPYVAALNFYPYFGHGRSVANGFLYVVLLGQVLARLRPALADPRLLAEGRGLARGADLLLLPFLLYVGASSLGFSSPSGDLACLLLQVALFLLLAHGLAEWDGPSAGQEDRALSLIVLATTLLTLKLSNAGFVAGVGVIAGAALLRAARPARPAGPVQRPVRGAILLSGLILTIWVTRGYLLSGYPAYPSTFGGLPFDWAVSAQQAHRDADVIYAWARQPWVDPERVLGHSGWVHNWLRRLERNVTGAVYPLAAAVAAALAILYVRWRDQGPWGGARPTLLLVPVVAGLGFCMALAPDPRFANALPWLLPATLALVFLGAVGQWRPRYLGVPLILTVAVILNGEFAGWGVVHRRELREVTLTGWQPMWPSFFVPRRTDSGVLVLTYTQLVDGLIWDGPIPATPEFNPALCYRDPRHESAGFKVK